MSLTFMAVGINHAHGTMWKILKVCPSMTVVANWHVKPQCGCFEKRKAFNNEDILCWFKTKVFNNEDILSQ